MRRSGPLILFTAGLAAAADVPLFSCQSLSCNPSDGSICTLPDEPGVPHGVGMAPNAVDINSTSLSFTLINGLDNPGFTGIGPPQYQYSDQQLFVGLDPTLDEDAYPSGCVLMMQYLAQTFPLETYVFGDSGRLRQFQNTTSCDGILNPFCRDSIANIVRGFNATGSEDSSSADRCTLLTRYVNAELQKNETTCGGAANSGGWIVNFMNVTGGTLPTPMSNANLDNRFSSDDCKPVLPQDHQLYKVAEMRQYYFRDPPMSNSDYWANIFGGQDGFTPVVTVVYSDDSGTEISERGVQFSCLRTFGSDGDARVNSFESSAISLSGGMNYAAFLAMLLWGGWVLFL